ncbi:MAG TPA: hypothetical protein VHS96_02630 [Bacteroidia bacterium]|nr:hypothetical protein [Bacteroidia bacterium]
MKKYLDYLFLLLPVLVWGLSSQLLGDQFALPNRLMLTALCTAAGAGAMLTQRKLPGLLSLVAGLGMLASVPVAHEIPQSAITLRLSGYDISRQPAAPAAVIDELLAGQTADLISLKANAQQSEAIAAIPLQSPYLYSHQAGGRSFLSRFPICNVEEEQHRGGSQVRGQLQAGDTAIRFVVLDLSGMQTESDARNLIGEALSGIHDTQIALIDTGGTGPRIPLEWISYTTGFAKSQRPWTSFTGSFTGSPTDNGQMLLYAPELRCKGFEQPTTGIPTIQGTYVVGG